jgi:hypothetical protein
MMTPGEFYDSTNLTKGITTLHAELNTPLMPGLYYVSLSAAYYVSGNSIDTNRSVCSLTIIENVRDSELFYPWGTVHGNVKPDAKFTIQYP